MLSFILILGIIILTAVFIQKIRGLTQKLEEAKLEQVRLKEQYRKYDELVSKEDYKQQLDTIIKSKHNEVDNLSKHQKEINSQIKSLEIKLHEVEEEDFVQSFGFYESKYDFDGSDLYKLKLDEIRNKQKEMIKNKTAAICGTDWTVDGSKSKGKKLIDNFLKLVLRAFNGECDAAVMKVKYNNINSLETRIIKAFETINKLAEANHCEITNNYLQLKLNELYFTHEFQEKKQEEREEQRRIQEQIREEQRALDEIEKAKEEAEREEKRYEQALKKARQEIDRASGSEKEELQQKIEQLTQQLEKAHFDKERAISRAQLTKSGHVYVISNIGSFGENIYKIGMTRRLEPLERVRELGGASVPFPFDVHAMIFSENAPEMENLLHKYFESKRLNRANERKEFFMVSLDEIVLAVQKISKQVNTVDAEIKFTKIAEAAEYRKTVSIRDNKTN
jgi:DNA repair exonuclease SbcCD ATPase subunit